MERLQGDEDKDEDKISHSRIYMDKISWLIFSNGREHAGNDKVSVELWLSNVESAWERITTALDAWLSSVPYGAKIKSQSGKIERPHVTSQEKERFNAVMSKVQSHALFAGSSEVKAKLHAIALLSIVSEEMCKSPEKDGPSSDEIIQQQGNGNNRLSSSGLNRNDSSDLQRISLPKISFAERVINSALDERVIGILKEVHRMDMLPIAIEMADASQLKDAVCKNQKAVLNVCDTSAILEKACEFIQADINRYMLSYDKNSSVLRNIGKWSPDAAPNKGLEGIHKFLVSCVRADTGVGSQGRMTQSSGYSKNLRYTKRTCNMIMHMLLRANDAGYKHPQAAMGVLLHSHLPALVLNFFSTIGISYSESGVRDLLARAAEENLELTGLSYAKRHGIVDEQCADTNARKVDVLLFTADNVQVVTYRANAGFLLARDDECDAKFMKPTDEELVAHVSSLATKSCECTKGCSTGACGCLKADIPCCAKCKCCKLGYCCQKVTASLHRKYDQVARKILPNAATADSHSIFAMQTPLDDDKLLISEVSKGPSSVKVSAALGVGVSGPQLADEGEYCEDEWLQHFRITDLNEENNCLATNPSKHGENLIKGVNDVYSKIRNEGYMTLQSYHRQKEAGLAVGVRAKKADSPMDRLRRFFISKGLTAPGAKYAKPQDVPVDQLRALLQKLNAYIRTDSKAPSYLLDKINKYISQEDHPERWKGHHASLCEALGVLCPTYDVVMHESGGPVISAETMRSLTGQVKEAMTRLRAELPHLYPDLPAGLHAPNDVCKWSNTLVQWWDIHKLKESEDAPETDSEQAFVAPRRVPFHHASAVILGSPGNLDSMAKALDTCNSFYPTDMPVFQKTPMKNPSLVHSLGWNAQSGKHIKANSEFYRLSGQNADLLDLDSGKGSHESLMADAEILRGDPDALEQRAQEAKDPDESEEGEGSEPLGNNTDANQHKEWLLLDDTKLFLKCRNVEKSADGMHVAADVYKISGKGKPQQGSWKRVTTKASLYLDRPPTFESAVQVGIRNPETCVNPTPYPRESKRGPPVISTGEKYTPVQPKSRQEQPLNVLGENRRLAIMCCDLGEMVHFQKHMALGSIEDMTPMRALLHVVFKAGSAVRTRAENALDLTGLDRVCTNLTEGNMYLACAFEKDLPKASQILCAHARGTMAELTLRALEKLVLDGKLDQQQANALIEGVTEGSSGDLDQHVKNYIQEESAHDNWVRAAANFVGDYAIFYMLYVGGRTLNVDMVAAGAKKSMTLFHMTGSHPKYAADGVSNHIIEQIRGVAANDLVESLSISRFRSDENILARGKSCTETESVGGMFKDEIHESMNKTVKNQNPLDEKALGREWMAQNIRHEVTATVDTSSAPDAEKHRAVFPRDYQPGALVCAEWENRRHNGQLRNVPDDDCSQRDESDAKQLVSLQIARNMYGIPASLTDGKIKTKKVEHPNVHSFRVDIAVANRQNLGKPYLQRTVTHKCGTYEVLCAPLKKDETTVREDIVPMLRQLQQTRDRTSTQTARPLSFTAPESIMLERDIEAALLVSRQGIMGVNHDTEAVHSIAHVGTALAKQRDTRVRPKAKSGTDRGQGSRRSSTGTAETTDEGSTQLGKRLEKPSPPKAPTPQIAGRPQRNKVKPGSVFTDYVFTPVLKATKILKTAGQAAGQAIQIAFEQHAAAGKEDDGSDSEMGDNMV